MQTSVIGFPRIGTLRELKLASDDQTSVDLLLRFIDDADDDVVFAACESLRKVGSEHDTADLLARMQKIPEDRQTIREEIGKTVQELHHRP